MSTPQLYFAHAHENRDMAKPFAERMMTDGINVWFDQWEIRIGDSLRRKMEGGLSTCTHFLALLTPDSIGKPSSGQRVSRLPAGQVGGGVRAEEHGGPE